MRLHRSLALLCLVMCFAVFLGSQGPAAAGEEPTVTGVLTANGETVELPYAYAYKLEKGFYNDSDPAWKLLFVEHPIEQHKLGKTVWDAAYVELGITKTAEFSDEPRYEVYMQNLVLSKDAHGNISGGTYPELELTSAGPERFAGHVYHKKVQEFFDDTFTYDFKFDLPLSDPNAPIGEMLPEGGGEPGKAYVAWIAALQSGDLEQLKKLVPAEMAGQMEGEDAAASLELLKAMSPTEVKVLSGSTDGETAILKVEGVMDGETAQGEVTMKKMDGFWMATSSSW